MQPRMLTLSLREEIHLIKVFSILLTHCNIRPLISRVLEVQASLRLGLCLHSSHLLLELPVPLEGALRLTIAFLLHAILSVTHDILLLELSVPRRATFPAS